MKSFRLECLNCHSNQLDDDQAIDEAIAMTLRVFPSITRGDYEEIGSVIGRCKKLRRIRIICSHHSTMDEEDVTALFGSNDDDHRTHDFPLEFLDLRREGHHEGIGAGGLRALVPFLRTRTQLNALNLCNNTIGDEGARILGQVLEEVRIPKLILSFNNIGKEGLECIFSSRHADGVKTLDLHGNSAGRAEMEEISHFLERRDVSIQELSLGKNYQVWDVHWLEGLLRSLRKNTTVTTLGLCAYRIDENVGDDVPSASRLLSGQVRSRSSREAIVDRVEKAILTLVCDSSSLDAFCDSNHVVHNLELRGNEFSSYDLPPKAKLALDINGGSGSVNAKLRRKLRSIYFRGLFDTEQFSSMKPVWMPCALSLVARPEKFAAVGDDGEGSGKCDTVPEENLNAIYNIVKEPKLVNLFGFPSLERLKAENSRLQSDLDEKTRQLEETERSRLESDALQEDRLEKLERLENEVNGLREQLKRAKSTIARRKAETSSLKNKIAELEADRSKEKNDHGRKQQLLSDSNVERQRLEKKNDAMRTRIAILEDEMKQEKGHLRINCGHFVICILSLSIGILAAR
ncbi:hypothetical protein ACHAXS_002564 [Conticribra weissflogii]